MALQMKTPWTTGRIPGEDANYVNIYGEKGLVIENVFIEDAEYIVACVNFCAGFGLEYFKASGSLADVEHSKQAWLEIIHETQSLYGLSLEEGVPYDPTD